MDDGFLSNNVHFESVANKVFDHEEKHPSISHANQIDVSKRKEYDGIYRKRTSDSQTQHMNHTNIVIQSLLIYIEIPLIKLNFSM